MKKILGIIVLGLLWCNVGITSEAGGIRESGSDQKCSELFKKEKIFEKEFLPRISNEGILVTYVGCNKDYDNWGWWNSTKLDLDRAHAKAYHGCVNNQLEKYKLTGCHLFSIDDVIVWGKNDAFVKKIEKNAYTNYVAKLEKRLTKKLDIKPGPPWVYSGTNSPAASNKGGDIKTKYFFTTESPSTLKKLIFKKKKNISGIAKGERRSDKGKTKKLFRSFNFTAEYEDDITVEFFIEYEKDKEDFEKAKLNAEYFSNMYGQMPHFLKRYNKKIYMHAARGKDDGGWFASGDVSKREFHINRSLCGYRLSKDKYANCAVTMVHELAHVMHKNISVISPSKWLKAKKLDKKKYCTKYAMKNNGEDFAESLVCWVFVNHKKNIIKPVDLIKIYKFIPNRLKFFDEMDFNIYPLQNS